MRVYAIGDLHLPGGDLKPMDVFGPQWENHFERISESWRASVSDEDLVLIPGDISWAMQLADAAADLRRIAQLPGTILILRGNHDYWWSSLTQLRCCLPERMHAVQNDAYDAGSLVVCGTRGWTIPGAGASAQDEKIYRREELRLRLSLDAAKSTAPRVRPSRGCSPSTASRAASTATCTARACSAACMASMRACAMTSSPVTRSISGSWM